MLEIHKIKDSETVKLLETESKIEYTDKDTFLGAIIDGKIAEHLCYKSVDSALIIMFITDKTNDFQLIYGLVKTVIFYAYLAQKEKVVLPLEYERVAKAVGFEKLDSVYELKLSDYQKKCGCC